MNSEATNVTTLNYMHVVRQIPLASNIQKYAVSIILRVLKMIIFLKRTDFYVFISSKH